MTCMAVSLKFLAISKGLNIDCYDYSKHIYTNIPIGTKPQENDCISDITISSDSKYLAAVSSVSKQLIVYELPLLNNHKNFILPRSASKIRFTVNSDKLLVADKSGDVLLYEVKNATDNGIKLLGHLSLLLDVLQTNDENYIITSDRDEKIRVTCYPNTYSIQTYCLGHKEFVNHIEILPHDDKYLTSTSGDGTIKCWNYVSGRISHTINVNDDMCDTKLKENFIKLMNDDGIEVNALPIVHYTISKINESSSLLVVAVHTCNTLLVYRLLSENQKISHMLMNNLKLDTFPTAIKLLNSSLYVYNSEENSCKVFKVQHKDDEVSFKNDNNIKMFETDTAIGAVNSKENEESIKVLYKRKFDNVREYQERKKIRLEKTSS